MILFYEYLLSATQILVWYRQGKELSNEYKVATLNIFRSRAIDGHIDVPFFVAEFSPVLKDCSRRMQHDI